MANFWRIVNRVLDEADVIVEVLDSRVPFGTMNSELEKKVELKGKKLVYVLNKCDLINQRYSEKLKKKIKNSVFVSSKKKHGILKLKEAIMKAVNKRPVVVGVVGYPNTGKSSVVNFLKGKTAAKAAHFAGFTKGVQKVRISRDLMLLDTPGVFPLNRDNEESLILMSALTEKIKEPDLVAVKILDLFIENYPEKLRELYGVKVCKDQEELLERIGSNLKKLRKGGVVDIDATSRVLISDWQTGKLNFL